MRRLRGRAATVALLALAAATGAGCGETTYSHTPETHEAAHSAVDTWLGSCANEDSEPVVQVLPEAEREIIFEAPNVLAGCAEIARIGPAPDAPVEELEKAFEEAKVAQVKVDGGFGTAVLRGPTGTTSQLQLEIDRGRWMLSNPPLVAP